MHGQNCKCPICQISAELEMNEWEFPYAEIPYGEIGLESPFSEAEEIALAAELLSLSSDEELEQFLGNMFKGIWKGIKKVGSFVGKVAKPLGGILKGVAKAALPLVGGALGSFIPIPGVGTALGSALGGALSKALELEFGELEQEEQELEMARRIIRIMGTAAKQAALSGSDDNPQAAARAAVMSALRQHVPYLPFNMTGKTRHGMTFPLSAEFGFNPEFEYTGETLSNEFEFNPEFKTGNMVRRPINLGEVVICGGKPTAVLDHFSFNKSTLRQDATRNHPAQIEAIAREIMARSVRRKPVPSVCLVGHTDAAGSKDYNYNLGLQRAKTVKEALCKALGKHAKTLSFVVSSMGEMEPIQKSKTPVARAGNRRVDVHLLSERVRGEGCSLSGSGKKLPPDTAGCGVPTLSRAREFEISAELGEWELEAPRSGIGVQAKLCLYQDASNTSHRNHFHHQALGTARKIGAIGEPNPNNCKPRVGATPYKTGSEIIAAMRAAWKCTGKKPLQSIHIFGHSGSSGLFGPSGNTFGLYQNSSALDTSSRSGGGRIIADIPTDILSDNVIFVLHGCNQAYGCNEQGDDNNFAQSLLEHLAGALKNPKVYGHYNLGCAGRDNSWCVYSKKLPKGKANLRPDYNDPGGCIQPSKAFEWEFGEIL
ncbi:MAG: OmpA family protein [Methylococcales bacterium]